MDFTLQPWQLYFLILAGWVNRQQQIVIDYLRTENQVLRESHPKKRILLSDDQRRRLAVKGKILGRKTLEEVGTLFTPDTILRWHRQLVARKWDYSHRRENQTGRPRVRQVFAFQPRQSAGIFAILKQHISGRQRTSCAVQYFDLTPLPVPG